MAKYISLLQLKGGVGKSTLCAFLAGYLVENNYKVLTIDADMQQGTLTAWSSLFIANFQPKNYEHACAHDMNELLFIMEKAESEFDFIITDAPPRMAEIMRTLIMVSDLVLMPLNVTSAEIWALEDTKTKLIEAALKEKPDLNIRLVFNNFKDKSSSYLLRTQVIESTGIPAIKQALFEYDTYKTVFGMGSHPVAYHQKNAKNQFNTFAKEVLQALKD